MVNLHRTQANWSRNERNNINENWTTLEKSYRNVLTTSTLSKELSEIAKIEAEKALAQSLNTQQQLDVVIVEGDSSIEAAQARISTDALEESKTYDTLKKRLDAENNEKKQAILARIEKGKFTRNEIDTSKDANLIDLNDLNEAARAAIQGLEPGVVNAVLGAENVKEENIGESAVSPAKINDDFRNMIASDIFTGDAMVWEQGSVLLSTGLNNETTSSNRMRTSGYVELENTYITMPPEYQFRALYYEPVTNVYKETYSDSVNKLYIKNKVSVRFVVLKADGGNIAPQEFLSIANTIKFFQVNPKKVAEREISAKFERQMTKNMALNGNGALKTHGWSASNGLGAQNNYITRTIASGSNTLNYSLRISLKVPFVPGERYYVAATVKLISSTTHADASGIAGVLGEPGTIHKKRIVKGQDMRISTLFSAGDPLIDGGLGFYFRPDAPNMQFVFGVTDVVLLQVSDVFGDTNVDAMDIDRIVAQNNNFFEEHPIVSSADVLQLENKHLKKKYAFHKTPVETYFTDSQLILFEKPNGLLRTQIYAKYDELVALYPEYITKATYGTTANGIALNYYKFTPHQLDSDRPNKLLKIIITGGVHGNEKGPVISTLNLFEKICKEWHTNDVLEFLRFNCQIILLPIVNPNGFNDNTRHNRNNIDLNRSFNDVSTVIIPELEEETKAVMQLLEEHSDADYLIDFHNMYFRDGYMSYILTSDRKINYASALMQNEMGMKWQRRYSFFPQDYNHKFAYVDAVLSTTLAKHAELYGIQTMILEVVRQIEWQSNWSEYDELTVRCGLELLVNSLKMLINLA